MTSRKSLLRSQQVAPNSYNLSVIPPPLLASSQPLGESLAAGDRTLRNKPGTREPLLGNTSLPTGTLISSRRRECTDCTPTMAQSPSRFPRPSLFVSTARVDAHLFCSYGVTRLQPTVLLQIET
jgi:hypothetical protein